MNIKLFLKHHVYVLLTPTSVFAICNNTSVQHMCVIYNTYTEGAALKFNDSSTLLKSVEYCRRP